MTNDKVKRLAIQCGFYECDTTIRVFEAQYSSVSNSDISKQLQAFAQAVIADFVSEKEPMAYIKPNIYGRMVTVAHQELFERQPNHVQELWKDATPLYTLEMKHD